MSKRGFTLIELLVAISIIAIVSSIGFVSYSQAQKLARDGKRKQDLRAISTALELYKQANKRYPCPGNNVYVKSTDAGSNWITDGAYSSSCNDTTKKDLDNTYINRMPRDPINTPDFIYTYRGANNACTNRAGLFFILTAYLENKDDKDRNEVRKVKDCQDGSTTSLTNGWEHIYIITSDD